MTRKKLKLNKKTELHQSPLKNLSADLSGDGRNDFIFQEYTKNNSDSNQLFFYKQKASGRLKHIKLFSPSDRPVDATIKSSDINGDGIKDVVIFDYGYKFNNYHSFTGIEPILLLGRKKKKPARSKQLVQAYKKHYKDPPDWYRSYFDREMDNRVAAKDFSFGDIDSDGDLDIWVESTGGVNLTNHFLINNGGSFVVDQTRIPQKLNTGPKTDDYFRYHRSMLADVNGDGSEDLILGQLRDGHAGKASQSSYVLLNNGKGFFDQKIRLPRPKFNKGFTMARSITVADFNGDELDDIIIAHTRIGSPVTGMKFNPVTGNFFQALIQDKNGKFKDFSKDFFGKQKSWSSNKKSNINLVDNINARDVNEDGLNDLIINYRSSRLNQDRNPTLLVNQEGIKFEPSFLSDGTRGSRHKNYFWDNNGLKGSGTFEGWSLSENHIHIAKEIGNL